MKRQKSTEAPAEVFGETDGLVEDAIKKMTPLWKQVKLSPEVAHPEPTGILHVLVHSPNQSSSSFANPKRYSEKGKKLHNKVIIWL